nr:hypothetical protein OG409_08030 [Streptomyces sp. NBC_00974]
MRAALWRHLQWRGLTLASLGVLWVWYGVGLIVTDRPGISSALGPLLSIACIEVWGALWIVCGTAGLVTAVLRPGRDIVGFGAVAGPPVWWSASFIAAAATGAYGIAWAAAPLYVAVVLLLGIVAALSGGRRRSCTCDEGAPYGQ